VSSLSLLNKEKGCLGNEFQALSREETILLKGDYNGKGLFRQERRAL